MTAPRVLAGKVCLVTGATSGLGAATARALAARGATVVLAGRDAPRCARAAEALARQTGVAVVPLAADLASQREVRALAAAFSRRFARLDVLVNNAGSYAARRTLTPDGLERTLAVNHLAPFLLTHLLLPALAASPAARVVNVASRAHATVRLDPGDLQGERGYGRLEAYGRSKLALVLFTYALARRLAGTRVTANAVDPGLAATNLGRDDGRLRVWLRNRLRGGLATPEDGARTSVHVAASPEVEGVSGRYFRDCREVRSSPASYDVALGERVWLESARLTGVVTANVR